MENFNSYISDTNLWSVWKDGWQNYTGSEIFVSEVDEPVLSGYSLNYLYLNYYAPYYYSEVNTTMTALGFDPNWQGMGVKSLSLWFYGWADNDANEPMYVKLIDSDNNSAMVTYDGDADDIKEESWHEWVMPLTDFTADVNADNTYDANVNDAGVVIAGSSNGYTDSNTAYGWYYYPASQWWNIWLDNGRYDPHRKKDIVILLWVKKRNAGNPASATFLAGGATVEWMATPDGRIRPPLPGDTPSLELEDRYINRTADPCVFVPTATWQLVYIHIVLPWNPRWVFLDIRGYNYDIMGGIIIHRCRSFLNLRKVRDFIIGFGYGVQPEGIGFGYVFFEDIGLCVSKCILSKRSGAFAKIDYAPPGNPAGDCVVNYRELEMMVDDWLMSSPPADANVNLNDDYTIDFKDFAILADHWLEEELWP
jgi:hypothetical protein